MKGTLSTIVLKLLEDHGRMYGYEITQRVLELTDEKVALTEGALYPTLHKLEKSGMLRVQREKVGGRMRKYYSLTQAGTESSKDKVSEFADYLQTMASLLKLDLQLK